MKKPHILLLAIFVGLTLILSACAPGPRVTGSPGIALTDDLAVVAYGNSVFGLDLNSGDVVWSYPAETNNKTVFYAPPLVTDEFIYVGDLANVFHKIDRETGKPVWTFSGSKGFFIGKAAEADGTIYAPSNDGFLYAIGEDGQMLWKFGTEHFIWSQPLVGKNAIYVGSMDHFVYAISEQGDELWVTEMAGAVVGAPVLSQDESLLYVGSIGKQLVALDTGTGETVWTFDAGASLWGDALLVDGTLYFADSAGNMYALNAENGVLDWQKEIAGKVMGGLSAIDDGFVLATEEGAIKAFNFDGSPKWESSVDGEIYQAPAVNADTIVAGTVNGDNLVYGYNLTGVQLWSTTPKN